MLSNVVKPCAPWALPILGFTSHKNLCTLNVGSTPCFLVALPLWISLAFQALGHVGRVIATTFESLDVLRERYSEIDETIAELEKHFSEVYHATWPTELAFATKRC